MADMVPVYLVVCWIMGMLAGYMIGRFYAMKKVLAKLDAVYTEGVKDDK